MIICCRRRAHALLEPVLLLGGVSGSKLFIEDCASPYRIVTLIGTHRDTPDCSHCLDSQFGFHSVKRLFTFSSLHCTETFTTNNKMAANPCYAILWLLLLWFIAWPVAFLASGLWIFLQPFEGA